MQLAFSSLYVKHFWKTLLFLLICNLLFKYKQQLYMQL